MNSRISAHPLHDHPVAIEPSPSERRWPDASGELFADPSLRVATGRGWDVRCPYGFEAVWDGGSGPEAIEISAPGFVTSRVGHGVLTFATGYLFQLDPGHDLWVRGPINQIKDGIQPLDQVVESDLLPVVGEVHWRFTRAGQRVRFERGEPFGTLLPYPTGYLEQFAGRIAPLAELNLPAPSETVVVDNGSSKAEETGQSLTERRAIVCFVEDNRHLIQQLLALRESWLYVKSPDTDLVAMGPADVLARLPDDLVKIAQPPVADDPVWRGYRYVNSIACLNGAGAEQLDRYTHLLRTDVDTFITPAWNEFRPQIFVCGHGAYSNNDEIRQRLCRLADDYGLVHRGLTNVGSTWYGPPAIVRRAAAFAEMLTKHLLTHDFYSDEGVWPGWYRGVALLYASEIAVNHCAPDVLRSTLLDAQSTIQESTARYPHIHCWHTDRKFSKHWFMSGRYTAEDARDLDLSIVRDFCLAMSFESLRAFEKFTQSPAPRGEVGVSA